VERTQKRAASEAVFCAAQEKNLYRPPSTARGAKTLRIQKSKTRIIATDEKADGRL
jgi:hypothetical protein